MKKKDLYYQIFGQSTKTLKSILAHMETITNAGILFVAVVVVEYGMVYRIVAMYM